jgi:hypothetical protein
MRIRFLSLTLITLLSVSVLDFTSTTSFADLEETTVTGSFQINLGEGATRRIEFHASKGVDGRVGGEATFKDDPLPRNEESKNSDDVDTKPLFLKAPFDCLVVNGNKAIMSGAVTEASNERYIGRRVIVVAQENGGPEDSPTRDKMTWGIYRSDKKEWLPGDSERSPENQAGPGWWVATDSEREDDAGISSQKETTIGCQTFPLSSFTFINAGLGKGRVRVKQ